MKIEVKVEVSPFSLCGQVFDFDLDFHTSPELCQELFFRLDQRCLVYSSYAEEEGNLAFDSEVLLSL